MGDTPEPQGLPQRPHKEYEDYHFHEDEVALPPDSGAERPRPAPPSARPRKLPPRPRRFDED